jgi:proteasome activator subunit 4
MTLTLTFISSSLEANLRALVRCCRPYFPAGATQEMLDEWRPLMCPYDVTMAKAMGYFNLFLPTYNVQECKATTYSLWFDEFMNFWKGCHNSPPWEPELVALYARLAEHNGGFVDWEEYIPMFFTRLNNSFNLPVIYKKTRKDSNYRAWFFTCRWNIQTF